MKRFCVCFLVLLSASAATVSAQEADHRFDRPARVRDYGKAVIDPLAWGSVTLSTLLDQVRDDPETWTFGDRALSNSGRFLLEETIFHGVAAMQDRSTWYYPCTCTDVPTRVGHAFVEAFTDHDRAGNTYVSAARIGAPFGAAITEALWRPDRSVGEAAAAASSSLIFTGLFNIVREFIQ